MVAGVMLAGALLAGVPLVVVALLALGLAHPGLGVAAFMGGVLALRLRRQGTSADAANESAYHAAVAAELRRGASLRTALIEATARTPQLGLSGAASELAGGAPLAEVAGTMSPLLPATGALLRAALGVAQDAGGRATDVFERLAQRARAEAEAGREREAATAQARLSAWVVGGLPVAVVMFAAATGRLAALVAVGPFGVGILVLGATLLVTGLAAVVAIARKAV